MQALGAKQTAWLEALESGQYVQDPNGGTLCNKRGYCCLGVACEIAGVSKKWDLPNLAYKYGYELSALPRDVMEYFGFYCSLGCSIGGDTSLAHMNDTQTSFEVIAATVRANPDHYFTEAK